MTDDEQVSLPGAQLEGYPDFGHGMLKYWKFRDGFLNLNHGSFGSIPVPVLEEIRRTVDEVEGFPDLYIRRTYLPILNEVRAQLARLLGASKEEVVVVTNATHGVNNVMSQIKWAPGDIIVCYSHTYGAIAQTIKHICDRNEGVSMEVINITYPCSHANFMERTEHVFSKYNKSSDSPLGETPQPIGTDPERRVRMLVLDSIASCPGMKCPWIETVALCKKYDVLSMVDGAHSIGQEKLRLNEADPDFFVSNCHKWLMGARSAAVLYVASRNQHLIRSTFPTSQFYESSRYPSLAKRDWSFEKQFEWMGTIDWSPFFGILPALRFRAEIGGEERIMDYNHALAVAGGKRVAERFGTSVMENASHSEGELTAGMVNVELPGVPEPSSPEEEGRIVRYFEEGFFARNSYATAFRHGGKWWIRLCAQVWNDLSDFDRIATDIEEIASEIRNGAHLA